MSSVQPQKWFTVVEEPIKPEDEERFEGWNQDEERIYSSPIIRTLLHGPPCRMVSTLGNVAQR